MRSLILITFKCVFLGLFLLALTASLSQYSVFGQAVKLPSVKIVSPSPGENIGANNTLIFRGVSSDNSSSDCQVSIILNDIRPYQSVVPIKQDDYSSWTYTLGASYTAIKGGDNKATAKITCLGTPENATKWNSINFNRINENDTVNNVSNIQSASTSENITTVDSQNNTGEIIDNASSLDSGLDASTSENITTVDSQNNTGEIIDNASSLDSGLDASTSENITTVDSQNNTGEIIDNASSLDSASNLTTTPKPLSIAVRLDKNPISVGTLQTAIVNVSDSATGEPIANATIKTGITSPSGKIINFENMTTANGGTSFSWIVARVAETGLIDVNFNASANGYISNQTSSSFEVVKNPSLANQTLGPFS
jgi:hypothetical protein